MKPEQLLSAIGDIDDNYIWEAPSAKKLRRPSILILAAALALLSAVGYATVHSGIIDRIFTHNPPSASTEKMIAPVNRTAEGELFSFTVNDYIIDGENLYADWTVHMKTDEELILVGTEMETEFDSSFFSVLPEIGSLSDCQRDISFFENGMLSGLDRGSFNRSAPTEPFQVTFHLALIRPSEAALRIDPSLSQSIENQPIWRDYGNGRLEFCRSYSFNQTSGEVSFGEMYKWAKERFRETGSRAAYVEMFEKFGFGSIAEQLSLTITIYPDGMHGTSLPSPVSFEQEGYTLHVLEAHFTGINAAVVCEIPLTSEVPPSVLGLDFALYIDDERVDFAIQKDYSADPYKLLIEFRSEGGFSETPREITIVPGKYERSAFIPFEGHEMTVQLE